MGARSTSTVDLALSEEDLPAKVLLCIVLTSVAHVKSRQAGLMSATLEPLMRPETKERTDTIIDSALRASIPTFERCDSWRAETEGAEERRRQPAE